MKELDAKWPDRLPHRLETPALEELRFLQGARSVVDHIRHQYDKQNKTIFKGS